MTKLSFRIIGMNKSLMLFPVISGLLIILIISTFAIGFWFFPQMAEMPEWLWFIVGFLIYVILFYISFFFQAALVACAYETMEGGHPTMGYGISKAKARAFEIFKWAIIAAIVGMILRALEERLPFISRIVGMAWSIATYFVIPIIVFEGEGAWPSLKKSVQVLKGSWGEALVGNIVIGLIFFLLALPGVFLFILAFTMTSATAIGIFLLLGLIYIVFIGILSSTASSVLQTALYRYVQTGKIDVQLPEWFPPPQTQVPPGAAPSPSYQPQSPPSY